MSDLPAEPEVVIHWSRQWRAWGLAVFMFAAAIGCAFLLPSAHGIGWTALVAVIPLFFLAFAGVMVREAVRKRRERMGQGEAPIQLDQQGFWFLGDRWTYGSPGRFRIPWGEVDGYYATRGEGEVGDHLEVRLRSPLVTYKVPPREPTRFSRRVLAIHEIWFDTSASQLVDLFQSYLGWGPGLRDQHSREQSAARD